MQEQVDWEAIERSPEFRDLVAAKRRFVVPRVVFFLGWYITFVLLAGYAEGFMGESVYEGLTVGYTLALSQFVMVWFLVWEYLRKADKVFDPMEERVTQKYGLPTDAAREPTGRFQRDEAAAEVPDVSRARGGVR